MLRLIKNTLRVHLHSKTFLFSCTGALGICGMYIFNDEHNTFRAVPFLFIAVLTAVPVCFGAGTEFSDGTLRNKLTAGVTKTQFLMAQVIAAIADAVIMLLITLIPYDLITQNALLPSQDTAKGLWIALLLLTMTAAAAVIFAVLTCLTQTKMAVLLCGIMSVGLVAGSMWAEGKLLQPEEYQGNRSELFVYDESGENIIDSIVTVETIPNNSCVKGKARAALYVGFRLSPFSCLNIADQLSHASVDTVNAPDAARTKYYENRFEEHCDFNCSAYIDLWKAIAWTLGECAVFTAIGVMIFRKRNII